ncbi:hypothetical protein V6N13_071897 [Hibiscus sabdariffa]|uniref:Uncharacterized protein n=1 Tax=Hibiscus sabdariffa TaxID=183260 RepID=A0ABR2TC64_9ROSI
MPIPSSLTSYEVVQLPMVQSGLIESFHADPELSLSFHASLHSGLVESSQVDPGSVELSPTSSIDDTIISYLDIVGT